MPIDKKVTHEAFGNIRACRINGYRELFGSEVNTGGYVRIEISQGAVYEDAYCDRYSYDGRDIVQVDMSEAQWVSLISRMNIGEGTPCTFATRPPPDAGHIFPKMPKVEAPKERLDRHVDDINQKQKEHIDKYVGLLKDLVGERLPKSLKQEFDKILSILAGNLHSNQEFAKDMLSEHKERLVAKAKIEIDAMLKAVVTHYGETALAHLSSDGQLPAIMIEAEEDNEKEP